jgi:hypothetical protein
MIGSNLVQKNIISYLKSQATVTAEVGNEIRSANYRGDQYELPAIRIGTPEIRPRRENGSCPSKFQDIEVSIYVITKGSSQLQCQEIQTIVAEVLRDTVIVDNGITSFQLSVDILEIEDSYTEEWIGELLLTGTVYD